MSKSTLRIFGLALLVSLVSFLLMYSYQQLSPEKSTDIELNLQASVIYDYTKSARESRDYAYSLSKLNLDTLTCTLMGTQGVCTVIAKSGDIFVWNTVDNVFV